MRNGTSLLVRLNSYKRTAPEYIDVLSLEFKGILKDEFVCFDNFNFNYLRIPMSSFAGTDESAGQEAQRKANESGASEDAEETPEQRLQWLRDRGIVVETPEDRVRQADLEASMARLRPGDPGTRCFRFVRIPADSSMPLSEEEAVVHEESSEAAKNSRKSGRADTGVDHLNSLLKPRFASGTVDSSALRSVAAANHLTNEASAGVLEKLSAASVAAGGGAVEVFRIANGINLYLDAVGALKKLPENARASRLASMCGFGDVPFFGNMFIGRLEEDGHGHLPKGSNVDFTLSDIVGYDGPNPPVWLQRAANENLERQRREMLASGGATAAGGMTAEEMATRGGAGDGYTWSQSPEDVEVVVKVPEGTRAKSIKVSFSTRKLKLTVPAAAGGSEPPFELTVDPLFGKICPDDCTWTVSDGNLVVTMEKAKAKAVWPSLG